MEFLTAKEVAEVLRISKELVYKNYRQFGGIKIGRVIRFEKEVFNQILRRWLDDSIQAGEEVAISLREVGSPALEVRVQDEGRGEAGGVRRQKKTGADKYGLHRLVREKA
jgi:hypothetical protein